LPDGNTSADGTELADQLSSTLAGKEYQLKVIDRALLQSLLAKDRIPDRSINREVILSIAETLDSRFMVLGTTEKFENGVVSLSSKVIDVAAKDWHGHNAVVNFGRLNLEVNLEPIDPLPPLPAITSSMSGERLQRAGVDGTAVPRCIYMPNPPDSEGARKLKLSGSVIAEAVINTQGKLENIRIVYGLMGGLNETTLSTMRSWRCHPASKDEKPVPVSSGPGSIYS
jgi:hypothetical protein